MFASLVSSTPIAAFRSSIEHLSSSLSPPPLPSLSLSLPPLFPIPLSMVSRFVKNDRDTRQTSPPFFFLPPFLPLSLSPLFANFSDQSADRACRRQRRGRGGREGRKKKEGKKIKEISRENTRWKSKRRGREGRNVKAGNLVLVPSLPPSLPPLLEIAHALLFLDG